MKISFRPSAVVLAGFSVLWIGGIVMALGQVDRDSNRAGASVAAPAVWPKNPGLSQNPRGFTLVMMVHPKCPCTRASLAELAQLMARSEGRVRAQVVFLQYSGVSAQWVQTDTWRQAKAIPGVQVVTDKNSAMSKRFGALTSGQTYLYDRQGRLAFSGGLTSARGHEGDNAGLSAVLALLRGQTPAQTRSAVFGCPLFSPVQLVKKGCRRCP